MLQPPPNERAVVVLAEDEPLVRMFASDFLDEAGFAVVEARHADDALLLLQARPDAQVLLTDVEMPGGSMDGFELARRVRARWPKIVILVVSGRAAPRTGDLPDGVTFIAKPYRCAAVVSAIHDMVGQVTEAGQ